MVCDAKYCTPAFFFYLLLLCAARARLFLFQFVDFWGVNHVRERGKSRLSLKCISGQVVQSDLLQLQQPIAMCSKGDGILFSRYSSKWLLFAHTYKSMRNRMSCRYNLTCERWNAERKFNSFSVNVTIM